MFHFPLQCLDWEPIRILREGDPLAARASASRRRPFIICSGFAYNPRSTLPAARIKKPTNRSVNPLWT